MFTSKTCPDRIFIRGLLDGKRYTYVNTLTLRFSDQYQKVLPRANIDLEFLGLIVDSGEIIFSLPNQKFLKVQNDGKNVLEKEKATVTDWEVIIDSNSSSPSTSEISLSSTLTDSEIIFSKLSPGESVNFDGRKERTVMLDREGNSQGTKQTNWDVIINNNSTSPSIPKLALFSTSTKSEITLYKLLREESDNFDGDIERTVTFDRDFHSL